MLNLKTNCNMKHILILLLILIFASCSKRLVPNYKGSMLCLHQDSIILRQTRQYLELEKLYYLKNSYLSECFENTESLEFTIDSLLNLDSNVLKVTMPYHRQYRIYLPDSMVVISSNQYNTDSNYLLIDTWPKRLLLPY